MTRGNAACENGAAATCGVETCGATIIAGLLIFLERCGPTPTNILLMSSRDVRGYSPYQQSYSRAVAVLAAAAAAAAVEVIVIVVVF